MRPRLGRDGAVRRSVGPLASQSLSRQPSGTSYCSQGLFIHMPFIHRLLPPSISESAFVCSVLLSLCCGLRLLCMCVAGRFSILRIGPPSQPQPAVTCYGPDPTAWNFLVSECCYLLLYSLLFPHPHSQGRDSAWLSSCFHARQLLELLVSSWPPSLGFHRDGGWGRVSRKEESEGAGTFAGESYMAGP